MIALDALGNATRRDILEALHAQPCTVGELAERFPVSRPAISRHLRLLTEAGLVAHEVEGTRRRYRVEASGFEPVADYLSAFWDDALPRFKLVAENLSVPTPEET